MTKVGFLFMADEILTGNPEDILIRNPKNMFTPLFVPSQFSLAIVFSVIEASFGVDYQIEIDIKKTDGTYRPIKEVFKIPYRVIPGPEDLYQDVNAGNIMSLNLNNVPFEQEGQYTLEVRVDGNTSSQYFYIIKKRSE